MKPLAVAVAAALIAGCSSSTGSTPPAYSNISGDYTGTFQDSQNGNASATGTLAQTANSAGGAFSVAWNAGTQTAQTSLVISTSNAVTGSITISYTNGTQCTYGASGNYDTATNVLSGTYSAVTNCAGATGSFSLAQQCSATVTSNEPRRIHTKHTPSRC